MKRRNFIKNSCLACMGIAVSAATMSMLQSCAALPVYKTKAENGRMVVPAEQFATSKLVMLRNPQLDYDILVVKHDDGTYKALYMRCTHQDQPLTATATGLHCTAHGSSFDLDGNVLREPASRPLTTLKTEVENQSVIIYTSN